MNIVSINSREQFMELAAPLHDGYVPAEEVLQHTSQVDLTTVTGGAGVGKNTVMTLTGIPIVTSDTTRDPRSNDGVLEQEGVEYFFRGYQLQEVYEDLVHGRYVQWAPGPNNNIYGSRNEAYPVSGPALIDVVAKSIPAIRELRKNFNSIQSAYIVAETFESWIQRFQSRGTIDSEELNSRLLEAHSSLVFGLDDEDMHFIVNDDKDDAANNLALLAERHESGPEEERARKCGMSMLRGLNKELGLPLVLTLS